jgi:hypothetical protein
MNDMRSRSGILFGLAASVGAFGAAAMMSAATAPTAHADDFTDVINAVDSDYAAGQTEFTTAFADFGGSNVNGGLEALFTGADDDLVGAPYNFLLGTVELAENEPVTSSLASGVPAESDFTSGLAEAETLIGDSGTFSTGLATDLSSGDYGSAVAEDYLISLFDVTALQVFLEGVVASF